MSIQPNITIFQSKVTDVTLNQAKAIFIPPEAVAPSNVDAGYVDQVRNQLLPNDIAVYSSSKLKDDIDKMVRLLGAYCKTNSISQIRAVVKQIHDTLNNKTPPIVKGWIRLLTNTHPQLDVYTKELPYWKNLYSEAMGTNTILCYADSSVIDLKYWSMAPLNWLKSSVVRWRNVPWVSPSYLSEHIREKMDSEVVELVQNAGHTTMKQFRRNIIFDAVKTTADSTGNEIPQERPIEYTTAAGCSLHSDTYHQVFRIMNGEASNKNWAKHDTIYKLDSGGYMVHVLINYLNPLTCSSKAPGFSYQYRKPLGVETDTFPNKDTKLTLNVNQSNDRVDPVPKSINDKCLEPVIIKYRE